MPAQSKNSTLNQYTGKSASIKPQGGARYANRLDVRKTFGRIEELARSNAQ
jgi:hypothetical protein